LGYLYQPEDLPQQRNPLHQLLFLQLQLRKFSFFFFFFFPLILIIIFFEKKLIRIGTKWTEPTLNCAPVSLYILEIDDWWHGLSFAPNYTGLNMEHLNKDLLPAVTYNFRLKTETEYGESEYSDITTMKTFDKSNLSFRFFFF